MKEALAQVRRDLGGGAVILGTREVRRRRLFGLRTRELVEVTASDGRTPPAPSTGAGAGRVDGRRRPGPCTRSSASSSAGCTPWSRT